MKLKIGENVYDAGGLDDLSLKMLLQLEGQTKDFGHPLTMADIQRMTQEINDLKTDEERSQHPDILWVTAVTIWAARKLAGEDVTFDQAVDFPLSQLSYLPDPEDHLEPANPTKPRARKVSGVAGGSPAAA